MNERKIERGNGMTEQKMWGDEIWNRKSGKREIGEENEGKWCGVGFEVGNLVRIQMWREALISLWCLRLCYMDQFFFFFYIRDNICIFIFNIWWNYSIYSIRWVKRALLHDGRNFFVKILIHLTLHVLLFCTKLQKSFSIFI